ncbi:hypothetical protein SYNPS1DRAFT_28469, partial [Syncephalis pseudoplumigaleata]
MGENTVEAAQQAPTHRGHLSIHGESRAGQASRSISCPAGHDEGAMMRMMMAAAILTKQSYVRMPSQLDLLWLLCDWHLQKNKTIREKIDLNFRKPSSAMDKTSMNVLSSMPVGYDKQQRSYWYFGDWPRVYRRAKRHPLQPYAYDAWEVVTTTLDELAGLIEVFRKEFLNTESELKNALQRLLDRATMVQRRKRQVEKSRERAFALLHSNTLRETRTRTKQHVVRYDYETMHIAVSDEEEEEDEDEEEDEETTFVYQRASRRIAMAADARANGGGSHTARSRLTRSSSLLDDDAFESESEKDATTTTTTINTMRASSNKRKRHGTPSTIPPSDHDSSNEEDDDAYEQQQQQQHKYNRHTTSVV